MPIFVDSPKTEVRSTALNGVEAKDTLSRRLFTVKEYDQMILAGILGEDEHIELLNGEIIKMMGIGSGHSGHVMRLIRYLQTVAGKKALLNCQNPFVADEFSEPEPDILLLKYRSDYYVNAHPRASDVLLLIEVSDSSLDRDSWLKLMIYARNGIREYWILNLVSETLEVYRKPGAKGYASHKTYTRKDTVTPLAFPKKKIAVKDLLLPTRKK